MLRLVFLILVLVGALAAAVSLFVGMGLYQVARLQEQPAGGTPPAVAAEPPATRPATSVAVATGGHQPAARQPATMPAERAQPAEVAARPRDAAAAVAAVKADPAIPVVLAAKDAVLIGDDVKLSDDGEPAIVNWLNRADGVEWTVQVPATGIYDVQINYASNRKDGGGVLMVRAGARGVTTSVRPTAGWDDYQDQYLGKVYLTEGANAFYIRPVYLLPGGRLMNLRSVTLTFVKAMEEREFESLFRRRRGF